MVFPPPVPLFNLSPTQLPGYLPKKVPALLWSGQISPHHPVFPASPPIAPFSQDSHCSTAGMHFLPSQAFTHASLSPLRGQLPFILRDSIQMSSPQSPKKMKDPCCFSSFWSLLQAWHKYVSDGYFPHGQCRLAA